MAAPAPSVRIAPTGIKLKDGYQALIALSHNTALSLWEMESKPPGVDGGDAINATTMQNAAWREMRARALKTLTPQTVKFAYDPALYTQLLTEVNREQTITHAWGDGSTLAYYGFLKGVEFDNLVEGQMPTGTATIQPTNFDPVNHVEAGPVLTSVAGT